jgi:hypothetical protein
VKTPVQSCCPLCLKECPRAALHNHINPEREAIRQATIGAIQFSHPAWVAEDGACERCWNSYQDVSRVLDFFKEFRDRNVRTAGRALRILSLATNGKDRDSGLPRSMFRQWKAMVTGGGERR